MTTSKLYRATNLLDGFTGIVKESKIKTLENYNLLAGKIVVKFEEIQN